jgi:glycosyltransferase involved in cell wall biosynthesis
MHVLFIHQAFPAQFGRLALELTKRYGWKCSFLIEALSNCPTPSPEMLEKVQLHRLGLSDEFRNHPPTPWPQSYARSLDLSQAVFEAVRARPWLRHDLVVSHAPDGTPTLFLPEALDCPIVNYCEYYFARSRRDLSYRLDLPPAEPAPFFPRCINAITLVNLVACDSGYAPTQWQRDSFPARFRNRIEVHFDGVDTELYRRRPVPRVVGGRTIPPGTRVVTYVARGLESMRGFDLFMRVAQHIARRRSDVLFLIAGKDKTYYGWDQLCTGTDNFKEWVLARGEYDPSRFVFLGQIPPAQLADVFCLSDLHLYLTVPFVLSWSLVNALSSGCVVLGSDVPPVREVITPGRNGLVAPLFDIEQLAETALRVLDDPATHAPLGRAARSLVEEKYSIEVAVPELKEYFERVASRKRP